MTAEATNKVCGGRMRVPRLHQFCYCTTLKEGTIISSLFFLICNFLGALVMLLLVTNDNILPVLLGADVLFNDTSLQQINSSASPAITVSDVIDYSSRDNITSMARVGNSQGKSAEANEIKTEMIDEVVDNHSEFGAESPNITTNSTNDSRSSTEDDNLFYDRSGEMLTVRTVCWSLLITSLVSLPMDLLLLAGGVKQRRWWLLPWLLWYLLVMVFGSVWAGVFIVVVLRDPRPRPFLPMLTAGQTLANAMGWYCYLAVFSFFMTLRERAARHAALMAMGPMVYDTPTP